MATKYIVNTNVYIIDSPSKNGKKRSLINKNTKVDVIKEATGDGETWGLLSNPSGYIMMRYLTKDSSTSNGGSNNSSGGGIKKQVKSTSNINIKKGPNATDGFTGVYLKNGDIVTVVSTTGQWSKISSPVSGYVMTRFLTNVSSGSNENTQSSRENSITVKTGTKLRSSSSDKSNIIGVIHPGQRVTKLPEYKTIDGEKWIKIRTEDGKTGWILDTPAPDPKNPNKPVESNTRPSNNVESTTKNSSKETPTSQGSTPATNTYNEEENLEDSGYLPDSDEWIAAISEGGEITSETFKSIGSIIGTFGLPYQFLPDTDMRIDRTTNIQSIGRMYASKIISSIPLFFIAPGRANFMTAYGKKQQEGIISQIVQGGMDATGMSDILQGKNGRYYTFDYRVEEYYQYCNPACRLAAILYGIGNKPLPGDGPEAGKPLSEVNWMNVTSGPMHIWGFDSHYSSIPFYIDADNSISESFSNSTAQSSLANTVNSISDMGRELGFLLGYGSAALALDDESIREAVNGVNGQISKLITGNNFLKNLTTHLGTVATGGKLMFPQIWNDSTFSKSYDIRLKFVSPNCNKISIFLNIIVPLIHLVCLVAPQSADDNPNGYHSPFIVRGIYKGLFNIDMGLITSMNVNKGAGGMFTPEGVPTSVEVDLTIKDLYDVALTITPGIFNGGSFKYNTTTNTLLMDYLSNLVGVNVYAPEVGRQIMMFNAMAGNAIADGFNNIYSKAQRELANAMNKIFSFRTY